MAEDVMIVRTSEETTFDDMGKMVPKVRVEFKVGPDGPFLKYFPRDGFNALNAKLELEAFARELRALRT
jgi:membrane-bound lytic murein transglycosylase MltF